MSETSHETLDTQIERLFTDLKEFPAAVAHLNPQQGRPSDSFDRYWLEPDYEGEPVSAESLVRRQEMTITYSDLENDDPENIIKLQYPVPGGGTIDEERTYRSSLTTVIKRTSAGMEMVTVEEILKPDGPGVIELNKWVNDPEDVARLKGFIAGAPERLIIEEPLSPEEHAENEAFVRESMEILAPFLFTFKGPEDK